MFVPSSFFDAKETTTPLQADDGIVSNMLRAPEARPRRVCYSPSKVWKAEDISSVTASSVRTWK
jgi:hypothetical protein